MNLCNSWPICSEMKFFISGLLRIFIWLKDDSGSLDSTEFINHFHQRSGAGTLGGKPGLFSDFSLLDAFAGKMCCWKSEAREKKALVVRGASGTGKSPQFVCESGIRTIHCWWEKKSAGRISRKAAALDVVLKRMAKCRFGEFLVFDSWF